MGEQPQPPSTFFSTNFNHRIKGYNDLAQRIIYQLGYPQVNIEPHINQIYDNISDAIEWFSKYAGYEEKYIIFDSRFYIKGVGIKMDDLINIDTNMKVMRNPSGSTWDTSVSASSGFDPVTYVQTTSTAAPSSDGSGCPCTSACGTAVAQTDTDLPDYILYPNSFDPMLGEYRKVVDCFAFEVGTDTGVNTLFTLEQSLAQQTYFAYSLNNYGISMVDYHIMKEWLDSRDKIFAQKYYFTFNPDDQLLTFLPEPAPNRQFFGLLGMYVEKPIKTMIREKWVQRYALALTKISVARIRNKFKNTTLLGGGNIDASDLLAEGLSEKKDLEDQMLDGRGDTQWPAFFVG